LGRRRRRVVRIVKKKLPTVFICPRCGEEAVRVTIAKDTGKATVMCALCQLKDEFPAHPAAQMIDVYSYFADRFYGVKDPRAIIPHERESQIPVAEEEPSEPERLETMAEEAETGSPMRTEPEEPPAVEESQALEPPSKPPESDEAKTASLGEAVSEGEEAPREAAPEKPSEEEEEPFADILGTKDKKRYSSNPAPEQQSEQTSQS
jgi:transcription elongation factor Elf1